VNLPLTRVGGEPVLGHRGAVVAGAAVR
jgi:hypothetical protein